MEKAQFDVVLMGKQKTKADEEIQSLISEIKPSQIPSELLYGIFIQTTDGDRFELKNNHKKKIIRYDNIEGFLKSFNITEQIAVVEIIIDLHKTRQHLAASTSKILDPIFGP
jgi:hypothetical protein